MTFILPPPHTVPPRFLFLTRTPTTEEWKKVISDTNYSKGVLVEFKSPIYGFKLKNKITDYLPTEDIGTLLVPNHYLAASLLPVTTVDMVTGKTTSTFAYTILANSQVYVVDLPQVYT